MPINSRLYRRGLITPDNGEKFIVELENATLTNIKGFLSSKPDLTLTINRSDLRRGGRHGGGCCLGLDAFGSDHTSRSI